MSALHTLHDPQPSGNECFLSNDFTPPRCGKHGTVLVEGKCPISGATLKVPSAALQPAEPQSALLELAGDRVVSFKDRGHAFGYIFRRITEKDWKRFFSALGMQSERQGNARVDTLPDFRTALIELVKGALKDVHGYTWEGGEPSIASFMQRLPYGHLIAAGNLLVDVNVATAEDFAIRMDRDDVVLDAKWGSAELGKMTTFLGLVHSFHPLTLEHQKKFHRATSQARIVGGSRGGKTVWESRDSLLLELYDELIAEVEGYAVEGKPLAADVPAIRANMDGFHKVAATRALFAMPEEGE